MLAEVLPEASTCPWTIGMAKATPGTFSTLFATSAKSVSGRSIGYMMTWPLTPRMRLRSSPRKPFITDMTMISAATPSMMPRKEKPAITETPASRRRARR